MIFLRLEEIRLLSLDDVIGGLHITWKQLFTNIVGSDGTLAGTYFEYSNGMWSHISGFVEKVTGVPFVEAITYYVLTPMGVSGLFDENTEYPPMSARGFRGTTSDLLIIGGTLASGGVSPSSRLRVISSASVQKMLSDWTSTQKVVFSFQKDKTATSMDKFTYNKSQNENIINGYGMGLWLVKG